MCTPPNITCRPQCCCHYRGPHVRASSRFGAVTSSYTLDGGYDKTGVMVLSWTPLRVADGAKAKGRWRPRLKHNLGVIMFLYTSRLPSLPPQPQALRGSTNPNAAGEEGWLVLASPREDASVQFRLPCLPDPRVRAARPNCMRSCSCMSGNGPLPRCYHGCDRTCNEGRPSPPVGPSPCLPRTSLLDPPPVYHGQL